MKMKRIISLFLLITIITGIFTGCAAEDTSTNAAQTLADYKNASIGIITGSSHDRTAKQHFPDAKRVYFNNTADMILATEQGRIDGYLEDAPFFAPLIWEGVALNRIDESVGQVSNGVGANLIALTTRMRLKLSERLF